jgi:glyoxylase-like metal-dependent hydrolase (beta-lactamase superfamily II)
MRFLLPAALALLPAAACAQGMDFSRLEVKATRVAGNVYVIEDARPGFSGGNIGVSVGADGLLLVDDKFAPLAPKIEAALKTVSDKPVRFVLNTHFHADHTDGNRAFGPKSTIIAHANSRKRIMARTKEPTPPEALPAITFEDRLTVHVNGEDIRAVSLGEGHTDTDIGVWFTASNVVHLGDYYFNGIFPFIDIDSGGTTKRLIASLEKILGELPDDVKIIPGHGPIASKADLKAYTDMLKDSAAIVEAGIKAGKSARKLKSEKALKRYAALGKGFLNEDAFIDQLYRDLSR